MDRSKLFKKCKICNRNFTWRKKWRKDWDNVIYCSEKCRRARGKLL